MTDDGLNPASPPAGRRPRPRYTLERKLASWTVVMVIVPTLICALWLNMMTQKSLLRNEAHGVAAVAQTAAVSLSGKVSVPLSPAGRKMMDSLSMDRRLGFVMVVDPNLKPGYLSITDDAAWAAYRHWQEENRWATLASINTPILLPDAGSVIAWKAPIWNPPLPVAGVGDSRPEDHQLEGFVILAVRDENVATTTAQLQATELTAAAIVCAASIPIVVLAVRRWTAPLRALLGATNRLAEGGAPTPVAASSQDDDLGMLTESFNQMAGKLHTARAALEDANAGLERKVQDRTAELERAKRELENEITDKNEFLRTVSHDLGAPLRNIGGMAALLMAKYKTVLADDAINKLERITANVKAQTDLINDLLELSRIRSRPGKRQELDLHTLVQEIVETLAFDLDRSAITLQIHGRLPTIIADRNRIRQVFQNLLDNAIKYMLEAPQRRIDVRCDDERDFYHFTVKDTGNGIAERDLPNIFQLYRRAAHSGTQQVPGRGVGLAGVKTIVETYGGHIWAESELGKGSTFHFTMEKRLVIADASAFAVPAGVQAENPNDETRMTNQ